MSDREKYRRSVQTPSQFKKRDAPSEKVPIRQDPERQAERYGRPTSFRMPDVVREALDEIASEQGIAKRDLVLYFVTKGLIALRAGQVKLPILEDEERRLDIPSLE